MNKSPHSSPSFLDQIGLGGLIIIALLVLTVVVAVSRGVQKIEGDLQQRASAALQAAGIPAPPGALRFEGRDAHLMLPAESGVDDGVVVAALREVRGVRRVFLQRAEEAPTAALGEAPVGMANRGSQGAATQGSAGKAGQKELAAAEEGAPADEGVMEVPAAKGGDARLGLMAGGAVEEGAEKKIAASEGPLAGKPVGGKQIETTVRPGPGEEKAVEISAPAEQAVGAKAGEPAVAAPGRGGTVEKPAVAGGGGRQEQQVAGSMDLGTKRGGEQVAGGTEGGPVGAMGAGTETSPAGEERPVALRMPAAGVLGGTRAGPGGAGAGTAGSTTGPSGTAAGPGGPGAGVAAKGTKTAVNTEGAAAGRTPVAPGSGTGKGAAAVTGTLATEAVPGGPGAGVAAKGTKTAVNTEDAATGRMPVAPVGETGKGAVAAAPEPRLDLEYSPEGIRVSGVLADDSTAGNVEERLKSAAGDRKIRFDLSTGAAPGEMPWLAGAEQVVAGLLPQDRGRITMSESGGVGIVPQGGSGGRATERLKRAFMSAYPEESLSTAAGLAAWGAATGSPGQGDGHTSADQSVAGKKAASTPGGSSARDPAAELNELLGTAPLFADGSYLVTPQLAVILDRIADYFKENPGVAVGLTARPDDSMVFPYSMVVAASRALAARSYLILRGIQPANILVGDPPLGRVLEGDRQLEFYQHRVMF